MVIGLIGTTVFKIRESRFQFLLCCVFRLTDVVSAFFLLGAAVFSITLCLLVLPEHFQFSGYGACLPRVSRLVYLLCLSRSLSLSPSPFLVFLSVLRRDSTACAGFAPYSALIPDIVHADQVGSASGWIGVMTMLGASLSLPLSVSLFHSLSIYIFLFVCARVFPSPSLSVSV